ncbi:MAG: methylated-DNA--[protein]-cysteine S-methyltransferase [Acidobacteriales bacterium]|nr:MAG: methylated-DNA--[protein]-cysteine S-methyltransferase [Terriglobales bacterium]
MASSAVLNPAPGITLHLVVTDMGIRRLGFGEPKIPNGGSGSGTLVAEAAGQLDEYFSGRRRQFDLPLDLEGTEFQQRVWKSVARIPYGQTRSYAQIATTIGSPTAVRAVGAANGANPVAIIVPCHRVIASGGGLGGYGGGLELKRRLLALEAGPGFW